MRFCCLLALLLSDCVAPLMTDIQLIGLGVMLLSALGFGFVMGALGQQHRDEVRRQREGK